MLPALDIEDAGSDMAETNSFSEFSEPSAQRIPPKHFNIQYNFCKNPTCLNFGVIPSDNSKRGTLGSYAITSGGKAFPLLKCNLCGEMPPMKSNIGIHEELQRLTNYLQPPLQPSCTTDGCENNFIPVGTKGAYRSYGTAKSGAAKHSAFLSHLNGNAIHITIRTSFDPL